MSKIQTDPRSCDLVIGAATYDIPVKPCCREVFLDDECDCAEIAAQVESAPLIVIGGAS